MYSTCVFTFVMYTQAFLSPVLQSLVYEADLEVCTSPFLERVKVYTPYAHTLEVPTL